MMTNQKRTMALLIAAAFIVVVLFSTAYVAAESDHDCLGGDCQICCQLSVCRSILESIMLIACAEAFAAVLVCMLCAFMPRFAEGSLLFTLVSLKVKLSD